MPVRIMCEAPRVRVPWAGDDRVAVENKGLHGKDAQEHHKCQEEKAQEP